MPNLKSDFKIGNNADDTPLKKGEIRMYDNYVPTLDVGDYTIAVSQQVNPKTKEGDPEIDKTYTDSQTFSVQGPRYVLPAEDLYSVFPPDNSQGVFDQFLPHVVMTKQDLPWERNVFEEEDRTTQTPWLALLLFVEDEQIGGQDALLDPVVEGQAETEAEKWAVKRFKTANIPANSFYESHKDNILWPALKKEPYETEDYLTSTMCTIIDLSPQAFETLIPDKETLKYMSHARQVNPTDKETGVLKIGGDGYYSVVVGNRLPHPYPADPANPKTKPKRNIVHLVSLEGFKDQIGQELPEGIDRVRMISFKSWSFDCLPEQGESFSEQVNGLLKDAQGNEKPTQFKLDVEIPSTTVEETAFTHKAIENGYVPMRYQTRLGEETFSWFRGPFSPIPVNNFVSEASEQPEGQKIEADDLKVFGTASSAMIYDKEHGLFDVSYGVAWETGRLMALSDKHFGQELLNWQRSGHAVMNRILERKKQKEVMQQSESSSNEKRSIRDQMKPYTMTDDFITTLATGLLKQMNQEGSNAAASDRGTMTAYADMPDTPATPQNIKELISDKDVEDVIREMGDEALDTITEWLSQLSLLVNVPFENLVPHPDLLPKESIRFFYLDANWLTILMEGALSIGIESSRDTLYHALMKDLIRKAAYKKMPQVRQKLLGKMGAAATDPTPVDPKAVTGLLLRSSVVSGWPGLEVNAYGKIGDDPPQPDITTHIQPLRIERLSDTVLLCLWPEVPAVITVDEPHEGIAFGFEDPPPEKGEGYYLYLRSLNTTDYGMPMDETKYYIDAEQGIIDDNRIINILGSNGLVEKIKEILPEKPDVNIRDYAVQMIKVPEQAVFAAKAL